MEYYAWINVLGIVNNPDALNALKGHIDGSSLILDRSLR